MKISLCFFFLLNICQHSTMGWGFQRLSGNSEFKLSHWAYRVNNLEKLELVDRTFFCVLNIVVSCDCLDQWNSLFWQLWICHWLNFSFQIILLLENYIFKIFGRNLSFYQLLAIGPLYYYFSSIKFFQLTIVGILSKGVFPVSYRIPDRWIGFWEGWSLRIFGGCLFCIDSRKTTVI